MAVEIVSDREVVRHVLDHEGKYVAYLGAGLSAEAEVLTAWQICDDIRQRLRKADPDATDADLDRRLKWDDHERRYATCLSEFGNAAQRVRYFRGILGRKAPVFGHYAAALLMRDVLSRTCLTTNFDKLLETAFAHQGEIECQAIRTEAEAEFWEAEGDKAYILKLHGDYDTHNVLNTRDETIAVGSTVGALASRVLQNAGLVALGAAGNEQSIRRFFTDLTMPKASPTLLSLGIYWGVYVGSSRPDKFDDATMKKAVMDAIANGAVSKDIVEMMERASVPSRRCYFFPVWGAGNFLLTLIEATQDRALNGTAELYLDHEMRLRKVFRRAGLTSDAVEEHLKKLSQQRRLLRSTDRQPPPPETVLDCRGDARAARVRVLYGDITSRSLMSAPEFADIRRAVISPEDTAVSAGGGVALGLLTKAGPRVVLNELAKLGPTVGHGEIAVTSGGNLPVHYIFHAAAIRIESNGRYTVAPEYVTRTVRAALACAETLKVGMILVPLIAAGLGPLTPAQSFEAVLAPLAERTGASVPVTLQVVVYQESQLPRRDIDLIVRRVLPDFVIEAGAPPTRS